MSLLSYYCRIWQECLHLMLYYRQELIAYFRMNIKEHISGFMSFIRKQGVVGVAVAFVLAGAVAKVVTALVTDIINPLLSIVLGATDNLKALKFTVGPVEILWGDFVSVTIDFLIIALVVYFAVELLGIEDEKKKK